MARATAEHTETPFELAALLSIAITSACIAGKAVISPEPGYCEPLNLYACPAMESGNRKTAVFNKLLEPFAAWERDRIAQIEPERNRLASDRRTGEDRIDRLRKKAASTQDPTALLREIRELEASLPVVPPLPRLYVDDCTPERLATLMAEQAGRMAVFSDEGGVFDLLAGRYSKGVPNLDLWLKGHSVSSVRVDRADRRQQPILLDRPHLTVGISPQPDVLESLRDKPGFRGRGLLARFLYGLPKSLLGYRTLEPHPIPLDVERRYQRGIHELLGFAPEKEILMDLSRPAYEEWKDFQRALEIQFRDGGMLQGLRDWGSKLAGAALRLAGVFHVADHVGRPHFESEIPKNTLLQAIEFATCLISHAQAVFALMDRDPDIESAEKLTSWIVRQGQPFFSVRDCFRAHQTRFKRVDAMLPALSLVDQHGYIRREPRESSGGRKPSDLCEVNPSVLRRKAV
jgi:putative DNA primase/helicase